MREYNQNFDSVFLTPLLMLSIAVSTGIIIAEIIPDPMRLTAGIFIPIAFFLGASMASFMAAMVERLPMGESINTPSHCACGRNLKPWENVPVLGWLSLKITNKGRTKCCDSELPVWYFLMESISGFTFAAFASWFIVLGTLNFPLMFTTFTALVTIIYLLSDYRNIASHDYAEDEA